MKKKGKILLADKNRHVLKFLSREFAPDGYRLILAENARELIRKAYGDPFIDLLILDPDLPDMDVATLFKRLEDRIPSIPIVIHSFLEDIPPDADSFCIQARVEKGGHSVEVLKIVTDSILNAPKPVTASALPP